MNIFYKISLWHALQGQLFSCLAFCHDSIDCQLFQVDRNIFLLYCSLSFLKLEILYSELLFLSSTAFSQACILFIKYIIWNFPFSGTTSTQIINKKGSREPRIVQIWVVVDVIKQVSPIKKKIWGSVILFLSQVFPMTLISWLVSSIIIKERNTGQQKLRAHL